ncbi:MAG TPA: hypothetical protein VFS95_12985 [Telluria sp.]|nr:hypothetical protein [Telluria sp.]
MKSKLEALHLPAALSLALTLAACGGGGGGDTPTPTPTPTPNCTGIQIVADTSVAAGKVAGASALSCGAPLKSIAWSQVSGSTVTLAAAGTPTVAIETTGIGGVIRLKADAVLADNSSVSATTDITVGAAPASSYITLRDDHSVRPATDTSIRAWPYLAGTGETVTKITWTQIAGPTVTMDTKDQNLLMFKTPALPQVANDVALKFRATMTTSAGRTDSDEVIVSIDRQGATPDGYIFEQTARVHPYRQVSAYAPVLTRCAYDNSLYFRSSSDTNLCTAATLPLLQAEAGAGNVPSVEQIMGRVLVSHDFLGANFESFLNNQDPDGDFRRLLSGVTAIVIGSHVRPSFYTAGTGAIYLDANNLWLTPEQRDVVTEVPDYRSSFDDALNFTGVGRMVKNNDYAIDSYPTYSRLTRSGQQLQYVLGRLMYHELGHASDFFSPADRNLNGALGIYMNVVPRINGLNLPSDALAQNYPLTSAEMKGLGQVMYQGATPNALQKSYTAAQVGNFFSLDVANDDYAYSINGSNSREDLAMLFEEFMVAYRYGAQYDVGYTNVYKDGMTADDLIVAWGQRGRIGAPGVKPRIKLVLARIAPWIPQSAVDNLPAPIQMRAGQSWTANLNQAVGLNAGNPRPANFAMTTAEKVTQVRDDVASRRRAH